jgi:mono/diheme cytochrome c family protein
MPRLPLLAVALVASVASGPAFGAQEAASFYEENCASCHTIGGGPLGGPDLKGVTSRRDRDWLIRFLLNPEAFAGDAAVKRMIAEADGMEMMSTDGLTREMAVAILALIDQRSGSAPADQAPDRPITAADVARGRALFTGTTKLAGSGPACVGCHAAGDVPFRSAGRLGPDLVNVHTRLGGHRGLTAWLAGPPTKMMRPLYRSAPLTADEEHALSAFLAQPRGGGAGTAAMPAFLAPAVAGVFAFAGVIGIAWRSRFRSVRQPLVARAGAATRPGIRHAPGAGGGREVR